MLVVNHLEQAVTDQDYCQVESQLVPTVAFERLPWFLPALDQLEVLQRGGRNIPGLGDLRISEPTMAAARRLLSYVTNQNLPVPRVAPISGGGIGITWNLLDSNVEFKVLPDSGEVVYWVSDERDDVIQDGQFAVGQAEMHGALDYLAGR